MITIALIRMADLKKKKAFLRDPAFHWKHHSFTPPLRLLRLDHPGAITKRRKLPITSDCQVHRLHAPREVAVTGCEPRRPPRPRAGVLPHAPAGWTHEASPQVKVRAERFARLDRLRAWMARRLRPPLGPTVVKPTARRAPPASPNTGERRPGASLNGDCSTSSAPCDPKPPRHAHRHTPVGFVSAEGPLRHLGRQPVHTGDARMCPSCDNSENRATLGEPAGYFVVFSPSDWSGRRCVPPRS